MSTAAETSVRRPGGRTAAVTRNVHETVLGLLVDGGIDACTFQAVAARAGIERSTLYRRYADRWAMIIDAIVDHAESAVTASELSGSFATDLKAVLRKQAAMLASPLGPAVMA